LRSSTVQLTELMGSTATVILRLGARARHDELIIAKILSSGITWLLDLRGRVG
jgi:hypothetical protein